MNGEASSLLLVFYALVIVPWVLLSALLWRRSKDWAFTPRWHGIGVPVFRVFLLGTLPLEQLLEDRPFVPAAFALGAAATAGWLLVRAHYVLTAPQPYPPEDSIAYNIGYIVNLIAFAIAMHSWVCLAVMINISLPALWLRYRWLRRMPGERSVPVA